jgi:hypothetical protein
MARRDGRDITLTLATDLDRFEVEPAARGMEDLADAAQDTGRALRDIDDDADAAARALRDVGDGADTAARDTDQAMGEIKDSGKGAAAELGGSFTGSFEDIGGALQGFVAEAGMAMGPAGMAGMMAGAALIGAAMAGMAEETERASAQVQGLFDAFKEIGSIGHIDTTRLVDFLEGLDQAQLARMADDADKLGLSVQTMAKAWAGDAAAMKDVIDARNAYYDQQGRLREGNDWATQKIGKNSDALISSSQALSSETNKLQGSWADAAGAADALAAATGGITPQMLELNDALKDTYGTIADASDDVEQASQSSANSVIASAQAQADATADISDSWADYAQNSQAAASEIIAAQEAQLKELETFQQNTKVVLMNGGEDLVAWANTQTDPAAAMAAAAKFTPDDAATIAANYRTTIEAAEQDMFGAVQDALGGTGPIAEQAGQDSAKAYAAGWAQEMGRTRLAGPPIPGSTGSPWLDQSQKRVP